MLGLLHLLLSGAVGQCPLLEQYCELKTEGICCVLQGDSRPGEPRLDHILAQAVAAEVPGHEGCPQLELNRNQFFSLFLLPCEGMIDANPWLKNNHGNNKYCDQYGNEKYNLETLKKPAQCNQSTFTIQHALFDDEATLFFQKSVKIFGTETGDEQIGSIIAKERPMIKRAGGSYSTDGTCNVINNGINDVSLQGLELNNEDCVNDEIPASKMNDALKSYGPDTMSIVRVSNIFEKTNSIRPTGFAMSDITLLTSYPYRKAYPGRSLIDVDNVRSTTWPPQSVFVGRDDQGAFFDLIIDLHGFDKTGPLYVDPYYNNSNGTRVLNTTLLQQNKINSRPLDMVLWDFQGTVEFGNFSRDRMFTVVVFADRDEYDINFAANDVITQYGINGSGIPGLTLLDSGDFYGGHPFAFFLDL